MFVLAAMTMTHIYLMNQIQTLIPLAIRSCITGNTVKGMSFQFIPMKSLHSKTRSCIKIDIDDVY
ncbi:hypothetical protein HanIR_Chr03g0121071 [Helianthus annuus]|nr:hypothetical protein HanIR_Chr03g0121071 [Helianthus annuus]